MDEKDEKPTAIIVDGKKVLPEKKVSLNPNCSEVVYRFKGMSVEKAVSLLNGIGINVITVAYADLDRSITWDGEETVLFDDDNPNCPDFTFEEEWIKFSHDDHVFEEPYLYASDVDYTQFPTLMKVVEKLGGSLDGYGGGTTTAYNEWKIRLKKMKIDVPDNLQNKRGMELREKYLAAAKKINVLKATGTMDASDRTILNPNCSECIFTLKGMTRDEAIAALAAAGIFEVTIPTESKYGCKTREHKYLADVDNELLPNFKESGNGNLDLEEWADGICVHGEMNLYDYVYPTMLKIQKSFPQGSWEDINGGDVEEFLQWYIHGMPPLKTTMDDKTREIREKHVNPQIDRILLNPNCSEIVLELPGMAKEAALVKLREIGIIEVEIPENVMYNRDSDKMLRVLVDRDNPNCPDFTFHDVLGFHETSGRPETWRSRAAVRDTLFQMAYARKLPGNGPVGDEVAEMTPENGKVLVDIAAAFKKPRLDYGDVPAIIDAWPGFSDDGKWHLKSVFGNRMLFKCSVGDPVASALQISRMLEIMGNGMAGGKSMDDIALAIHEKYPDYDAPSCYFMTGSDAHSLFPTMKKVAALFNRDWHGHDGSGTASYEDWEDGMEATRIAIGMRARGKTDEQVVEYLKKKYMWCEKVIDAVERGEPLSTGVVDHQDDAGRQKRATHRGFPEG